MPKTRNNTTRAVLAPLPVALLAGAAAPAAPAQAALPPAAAPLVAKLAAAKPSSERFKVGITVRPRRLPKGFSGLRKVSITQVGETTLSAPVEAVVTSTALGSSETERVIGDTAFVDEPALGRHDGGRPWVESKGAPASGGGGFSLGIGTPGAAAPFGKLVRLLETGREVKVLGTTTISAQPVTRISFTLNPSILLPAGASRSLGGKLKHATSRLEVDLNAEGLPLRTAGLIAIGKIRIGLTAELTAVDFPLTVAPPPSSQTISAKQALALLKKRSGKK